MKKEFENKFRDKIRVIFNWECLFSDYCKVGMRQFPNIDSHNWFTPWYIDTQGSEVSWNHQEAKPLSLSDVMVSSIMIENRYDKIMNNKFIEDNISIEIPMYFLGDNKYLVLDGNHRLLALLFNGFKANIFGYIIWGPIKEYMVPDLKHY